jgi:[ribosomal protein S5]-alanine N-acetyltransferase
MNASKFISGDRVYLREVRVSDVNEQYYNWLNDPEINQYLETRFVPRSRANIEEFVKRIDGNENEPFFAICLHEDDRHVGNIKIGPINWHHRSADISLFVGDKSLWGKGVATEAIALLTGFGFRTLNLNKIKAGCYGGNLGSAKAFEKCGYLREGLLREQFISHGQKIDMIILGITASDFWK